MTLGHDASRRRPTARCRSTRVTTLSERAVAAADQSSRPVSGDDGVVQSRAGRIARRGGRGDQAGRKGHRHAGEHRHRIPGRGARVPGLADQHGAADPRRDRDDVHRARRAVRKLHPSDHDPVDAAVGRHRRAARADARARRSRHRRDHRHHPADRHRQEERDHDGRLRARRRTQRRHSRRARRSTRPACCASARS